MLCVNERCWELHSQALISGFNHVKQLQTNLEFALHIKNCSPSGTCLLMVQKCQTNPRLHYTLKIPVHLGSDCSWFKNFEQIQDYTILLNNS
jgi:hypothetical protein